MYDYLQLKSCQKIWQDVSAFCNEDHNEDEVVTYCLQTMNEFFKLHECTLFRQPTKMNKSVFEGLLSMFSKYLMKKHISFPSKSIIGPQYTEFKVFHKENESPEDAGRVLHYKHNIARRLTSKIPLFFGIQYTSEEIIKYKREKDYSDKLESILKEHKKLYDILFLYSYPSGDTTDKESNTILGNLAKTSIFRFDKNAEGNYRKAFDYIQRELIYRFYGDSTWSKLLIAINLSLYTVQMKSVAFSIINQLMNRRDNPPVPFTIDDEKDPTVESGYFDRLFDYIIKKCEPINTITVYLGIRVKTDKRGKKKKERIEKNVNTINMKLRDNEAIILYAYSFFFTLPTSDYLEELRSAISSNKNELDRVIDFSIDYILRRDRVIDSACSQPISSHPFFSEYVSCDMVDVFLNDAWDEIIPVICIDGFVKGSYKKFCKDHRENMITFLRLYTFIFKQDTNYQIPTKYLFDLLHLYVMLKRCKIDIPTASIGYNKNDAAKKNKLKPKPVKIDTAMELIREKWTYQRDANKVFPSDVYMRTVIIETYLSAVMYMVVHGFCCDLFLKRIEATEKLFYALLQKVPSITLNTDKPVNFGEIAHELLEC